MTNPDTSNTASQPANSIEIKEEDESLFAKLKNIFFVAGGQMMGTGLGFVASIMVARLLKVEDFGLFSLFLATMLLGVEFSGKSLDWGMVRYSAEHFISDKCRAEALLREALLIRTILAIIVMVAGVLISPWIVRELLDKPELTTLLQLAFIGTIGLSIWWYCLAALQSQQLFMHHGALNLGLGLLKVIVVGCLFILGTKSLDIVAISYVGIALLSCLFALRIIPLSLTLKRGQRSKLLGRFLHFSKWVVITNLIMAVQIQQSLFWVNNYSDTTALGRYSSAWNLTLGMDVFALVMITVFLPSASKLSSATEYRRFARHSILISLIIITCLSPLFIYAEPIITTLYSEDFKGAGNIFQILFAGTLLTVMIHPISVLLLARDRPQPFFYAALIILLVSLVGNMLVVPIHGATGAAIVAASSKVLYGLVLVFELWRIGVFSRQK